MRANQESRYPLTVLAIAAFFSLVPKLTTADQIVMGGGYRAGDYGFNIGGALGGVYDLHALAFVATADIDDVTGTKPGRNATKSDATRLVSDSAGGITARARAVITIKPSKSTLAAGLPLYTDRNSSAHVFPNTPQKFGRAEFKVKDPAVYELPAGAGADTFVEFVGLEQGFSIQTDENGRASYRFTGGSNRPGFESLFDLFIMLEQLGPLSVDFTSNPALGLSDAAIEDAVRAALQSGFNAADHSFSLASDLDLFTFTVPGIMGGETYEMSTLWHGAVEVVPEPSSVCLLASGIPALIVCWNQRRRKEKSGGLP